MYAPFTLVEKRLTSTHSATGQELVPRHSGHLPHCTLQACLRLLVLHLPLTKLRQQGSRGKHTTNYNGREAGQLCGK